MKQARYGVIFTASGRSTSFDSHQRYHALFALVRDMNAHARFACVPLGGAGNVAGAENVLTWQTGYPFAVNLARGYPRFGPRDFTAEDVLGRGEADAALIVGYDPEPLLTPAAQEYLARIPTVILDSRETVLMESGTVVFRTATYGIATPGTVYRSDGVPIPLRPALASPLTGDEEILKRILHSLQAMKTVDNR
jgi:formylmethanofuran dehydrogenase subunit B